MFFRAAVLTAILGISLAQFNPTVTGTCAEGPEFTVTLTGGADGGVIFIDGKCETQATTTTETTFTFNAAACTTGGAPALGETFKIVVQQSSTINFATDKIFTATCTLSGTDDLVLSFSATGEDTDESVSLVTSLTFTSEIKDAGTDAAVTSTTIGTSVKLSLSIPTALATSIDFKVNTLTVTNGADVVNMVTAGCSDLPAVLSDPVLAGGDGILDIAFDMFIPKDTSTDPSLPGSAGTALTYDIGVEYCDGTCTAASCARRKRSVQPAGNVTELTTAIIVYPVGYKHASSQNVDDDKDIQITSAPMIGALIAMAVALVLCLLVAIWLFCRLRGATQMADKYPQNFANAGFKP